MPIQHPPNTYVAAIIPARWSSTRFPGKPLHILAGKPMVQHVWERCRQCSKLDRVAIATDNHKIKKVAESFGAEVIMTSEKHISGTDRIAEAVSHIEVATHVVNVQGDEPMIDSDLIDELVTELLSDSDLAMVTAANELKDENLFQDTNIVKCVLNKHGNAMYFSRSPIPCERSKNTPDLKIYRHKGIYGYEAKFLQSFIKLDPTPLELAESLEQLRALEHGTTIRVVITNDEHGGVDTPEQAEQMAKLLRKTAD
jgi:3-deoxy-manno-octulosonate cytidylyltransferase (CMP-KDO synthetase)